MAISPDGEMGSPLIPDIAGITEAVRTLADQELRPLDLQVIYMLKAYFESEGRHAREE